VESQIPNPSLPPELQRVLLEVAERAEERGWRVYLVGGYVRDLLLGRPNDDVDVAVEGGAIDLANALQSHAEAKIDTADRFGTAHLTLGPGLPDIDLVTARRERYLSPGALPTVEPGTIDDDLARRDFTINALSIPVISGRWPVVSDQGGRQTLTHERSEGSWPLTTDLLASLIDKSLLRSDLVPPPRPEQPGRPGQDE